MMLTQADFRIQSIGTCRIDNPMKERLDAAAQAEMFTREDERLLYFGYINQIRESGLSLEEVPAFEAAGPREKIFFMPSKTRAGIVTCGGLCPGLNDVIRRIVLELWYIYGVRKIWGFRYGYQGLVHKYGHEPVEFDPDEVDGLQDLGGTVLASSRGNQDPIEMVDCLEQMGINMLFTIGGDGTQRGALAIAKEIEKRGSKIVVVGVPKTIDNDIMYIGNSFGFNTAFSTAVEVLKGAHVEARGAPNGIGLVKLMGRHSGFIACHASVAMADVNFVLIPEVPFSLDGENGFLETLRKRLEDRQHAVVVVAEGAGQHLLETDGERDASGNLKFADIGIHLRDRIKSYFQGIGMEANIKYIDPSYIIRSVPASPQDSIYCMQLAQMAVHAAMCGKTEMVVGCYHGHFVHIPICMATSERRKVDPNGDLWLTVLESTGQPAHMK